MSRPIVVYGAGGHGRELASLIGALCSAGVDWDLRGFLTDDQQAIGRDVAGLSILGGEEWLVANPGTAVAMGIGSPSDRSLVASRIAHLVGSFPPLAHPAAVVMDRVSIGPGAVVFASAVVSVDVELGAFATVNALASISHDCSLGPFATLGPHVTLAGGVTVLEGADLGAGASCVPGVTVGEWSIIGAGAVVAGNLPPNCTAVGVPAKAIKQRPAGWQNAATA